MSWILVVVMLNNYGQTIITTAQFNSAAACKKAATFIQEQAKPKAVLCVENE